MKTKIAVILIISAVLFSFGATRITKVAQSNKKIGLQSSNRAVEPVGGFVSEDH